MCLNPSLADFFLNERAFPFNGLSELLRPVRQSKRSWTFFWAAAFSKVSFARLSTSLSTSDEVEVGCAMLIDIWANGFTNFLPIYDWLFITWREQQKMIELK